MNPESNSNTGQRGGAAPRFCSNCGQALSGNVRFCPNCGQPVSALSALASGPTSSPSQPTVPLGQPAPATPWAASTAALRSPRPANVIFAPRSRGWLIASCVVLLCVTAVDLLHGFAMSFFYDPNDFSEGWRTYLKVWNGYVAFASLLNVAAMWGFVWSLRSEKSTLARRWAALVLVSTYVLFRLVATVLQWFDAWLLPLTMTLIVCSLLLLMAALIFALSKQPLSVRVGIWIYVASFLQATVQQVVVWACDWDVDFQVQQISSLLCAVAMLVAQILILSAALQRR